MLESDHQIDRICENQTEAARVGSIESRGGKMNKLSRASAAVAAAVLMLSGPMPAFAAEQSAVVTDVSAKASPIKHRRIGSIRRHVASVTPLQRQLGCSGEWCGRQFVLIIGIGF
jgi:hypothetical protein